MFNESLFTRIPKIGKLTVVPDVHGRYFWVEDFVRNSEKVKESDRILFLGDYLDPHSKDIKYNTPGNQVGPLLDILDLRIKEPGQVTLLVGNHDLGYLFNEHNSSRQAEGFYWKTFVKIFQENADLFRLTSTFEINGKKVIASHAGITKQWIEEAKSIFGYEDTEAFTIQILKGLLNKIFYEAIGGDKESKEILLHSMSMVAPIRGGNSAGSPLWCDSSEWADEQDPFHGQFKQIIGHNQLTDDMPCKKLTSTVTCFDMYKPQVSFLK